MISPVMKVLLWIIHLPKKVCVSCWMEKKDQQRDYSLSSIIIICSYYFFSSIIISSLPSSHHHLFFQIIISFLFCVLFCGKERREQLSGEKFTWFFFFATKSFSFLDNYLLLSILSFLFCVLFWGKGRRHLMGWSVAPPIIFFFWRQGRPAFFD